VDRSYDVINLLNVYEALVHLHRLYRDYYDVVK